MATRRQRRVAEQIHRELSLLLMHDVHDPRLADITITEVDITRDLLIAHVYFTVLGGADEEKQALAGLAHAGGFLRTQLAGRVQLRFAPELTFKLDKSAEHGRHIDDLLAQIATSGHSEDGS